MKQKHTTDNIKLGSVSSKGKIWPGWKAVKARKKDPVGRSTDLQPLHLVPKSRLHRFPALRQPSGFLQLLLQTQDASAEAVIFLLGLPKCGFHCCPTLPQHQGLLLGCQFGLRAVWSSGSDRTA